MLDGQVCGWTRLNMILIHALNFTHLADITQVCTCSQQVGEKAVKSLFLRKGVDYPWTHSIIDLLDEVKELTPIEEAEFFELRHCASKLDPHYIETRYPDATAGNQAPYKYYDCERSEECLKNARRLLEWAENQIQ